MNVILVVAISKDGFITKGNEPDPSTWTSKEDEEFFSKILGEHTLSVFGRKTYEELDVKSSPEKLKIVLTRKPEKFSEQEIPGKLEFHSLSPNEFVNKYSNKYESCLVLGGSYVFTDFLKSNQVDEIYMTVEPVQLNDGVPFLRGNKKLEDVVKNLPEPDIKVLNDKGTILKHYVL